MAKSQITILVADDQKGVRRLLSEVFRRDEYIVHLAADGREAIRQVQQFNPDIMLLDMKMPGMDGLATLRELRQHGLQICVILMTAYGELEIVKEAMSLGARAHITKPFDVNELKDLVGRLVAEQREKE
ncbi:MAG: response regulator [bacterium]